MHSVASHICTMVLYTCVIPTTKYKGWKNGPFNNVQTIKIIEGGEL